METLSTLRFATDAKMIKNTAVVNEVRFGSVAALQQEIAKLQQELQQMRASRSVSDSPGFSAYLLRELALCNQTCSELYCRTASLVRERNGWSESVARLRNELRTKEDVMQRVLSGTAGADEYVKSLKSTVQSLLRLNLDGNTVGMRRVWDVERDVTGEIQATSARNENRRRSDRLYAGFHGFDTRGSSCRDERMGEWKAELAKVEKHSMKTTNGPLSEEENGVIASWIATEKQKLLMELEEVRSRCDELYADLADCQEQLRIEHLQKEIAHQEKRIHIENESIPYSQLLVQIDCQHVENRFYLNRRILCASRGELSRI